MEKRHQGVFHSASKGSCYLGDSLGTHFITFLPQLYLGLCASYANSQIRQIKTSVDRAAVYTAQPTLTPRHLAKEVNGN